VGYTGIACENLEAFHVPRPEITDSKGAILCGMIKISREVAWKGDEDVE
jgi:hypothetical protein